MGELVYSSDEPEILAWAENVIQMKARPDAQAMGWRENGVLRAVVIWDNFSDVDCYMHIATDQKPHSLKRGFMCAAFSHPFIQWNLRRVTGLVASDNKRALRLDIHLGFIQEGYLRNATRDGDFYILGMLREHCRFIPKEHRTWRPEE